ncbi:hypothetical protein KY326_03560, partial [Candidatus Woesearchaeota archaeon]|nr:hypothetical protein [Candidatus Woesearchaeota archaeon]
QPMTSFTKQAFQPEPRPAKKIEPKKNRDIEELKEYLTNAAKQGFTFDEVHEMLKKSGWPEDLIEKAYDEIQHGL